MSRITGMDSFNSVGEAIDAIVRFDRERFSALPDHVQAELTRLASVGVSPVDRIVNTAELLYANQGKLRMADKELAAALFDFAALNGWHNLNDNNRADKIKNVLVNGEKAKGAAPEPLVQFAAKPKT